VSGIAAPLDIQNIDTDMIIPKEFLKTIKRAGLGFAAFAELRYENAVQVAQEMGQQNAVYKDDFVFNKPEWKGAEILVAGDNFGCGSSREHAPWSLVDLGLKTIISSGFADIFYNNCFKNGLLPVILPREQVEVLLEDAKALKPITVDLESQRVTREDGSYFEFEVDPTRKHNIYNGLDDIGLTLQKADEIAAFEAQRDSWLNGATTRARVKPNDAVEPSSRGSTVLA